MRLWHALAVAHPAAHGLDGSDCCDRWKWVITQGTKHMNQTGSDAIFTDTPLLCGKHTFPTSYISVLWLLEKLVQSLKVWFQADVRIVFILKTCTKLSDVQRLWCFLWTCITLIKTTIYSTVKQNAPNFQVLLPWHPHYYIAVKKCSTVPFDGTRCVLVLLNLSSLRSIYPATPQWLLLCQQSLFILVVVWATKSRFLFFSFCHRVKHAASTHSLGFSCPGSIWHKKQWDE